MASAEEYEVKFKLYDGNELEQIELRSYYEQLRDEYLQRGVEGSVNAKVISYFFEGMVNLIDGDLFFWDENYIDSLIKYQEAKKFFTRFVNSRGVEARLDRLAERMLERVEGLILMSEGLQMKNPKKRINLLSSALSHFNNESRMATELDEKISAFVAYARALNAEAFYWQDQGDMVREEDTFLAKKHLMEARMKMKQAAFIDPKMVKFTHRIENAIDDLTKERILQKAERLGDLAILASEEGDYDAAKSLYLQATLFYNRASHLAADAASRRFLLSMKTVLEASILECDANKAFKLEDELEKASEFFNQASVQIEKAIALIGTYGNNTLLKTFSSQDHYYKGMCLLSKGVLHYDNEEYELALEVYKAARQEFEVAMQEAKEADNSTILDLGKRALLDLENYVNMSQTLM